MILAIRMRVTDPILKTRLYYARRLLEMNDDFVRGFRPGEISRLATLLHQLPLSCVILLFVKLRAASANDCAIRLFQLRSSLFSSNSHPDCHVRFSHCLILDTYLFRLIFLRPSSFRGHPFYVALVLFLSFLFRMSVPLPLTYLFPIVLFLFPHCSLPSKLLEGLFPFSDWPPYLVRSSPP